MSKQIGRVTYEHRYVIITVPDDWSEADPLPPPSPEDRWFDSRTAFAAAVQGPWTHKPINRRPWNDPHPAQARQAAPRRLRFADS